MTDRRLFALALRVLGVSALVEFTSQLGNVISGVIAILSPSKFDQDFFATGYTLISLTSLIFLALIAFVLIARVERIANILYPEESQFGSCNLGIEQIYRLAFTVLGIALIAWTLPLNLAQILINFSLHPVNGPDFDTARIGWTFFLKMILELGIAVYLISGAPKLLNLVRANFQKPDW